MWREARAVSASRGLADLALAGEEDEHVLRRVELGDLVDAGGHGLGQIGLVGQGGRWMTSTGNVRPETWTTGAPPKKVEKRSTSQRGRADDDPQIGPPREEALHEAEEEVDVEAALVGLVEDDGVVAARGRGRPGSRPGGCRRS